MCSFVSQAASQFSDNFETVGHLCICLSASVPFPGASLVA